MPHDDITAVNDPDDVLGDVTPLPRAHARGSDRVIAPRAREPIAPRAREPIAPRGRSAGESIARLLYFASGALIAAVVAVYGRQIWRQAGRAPEPAVVAARRSAAAALVAAAGRIELAADRRMVIRLAGDAARWAAPQPAALEAIELAGPVVLGHTPGSIVAIDLDSGRTRFTWALPDSERWGAQRPVALGSCLAAVTTRGGKVVVRCLDLATGAVRWTAAPAGAHDCTQPLEAVPGGYVLPCPGWAAVLDERTGAIGVEPGGLGVVQDDPAYLLRARSRLSLSPWSAARRRFVATGEIGYPAAAAAAAAGSAVLYKDRLVIRAVESSDELATIVPRAGNPVAVAAPVYRLADATPLVRGCGGATSPRYQLLELVPRIGASFDPATAGDRALALLDVETGALAWTSRKLAGLRAGAASGARICRGGRYFVPLELPARGAGSALWIVDAETGKTLSAVALDPELEASFAQLTADQIDDDRVVGVGRAGPFELRWQPPGRGLHDARRELEDALGPLP